MIIKILLVAVLEEMNKRMGLKQKDNICLFSWDKQKYVISNWTGPSYAKQDWTIMTEKKREGMEEGKKGEREGGLEEGKEEAEGGEGGRVGWRKRGRRSEREGGEGKGGKSWNI